MMEFDRHPLEYPSFYLFMATFGLFMSITAKLGIISLADWSIPPIALAVASIGHLGLAYYWYKRQYIDIDHF